MRAPEMLKDFVLRNTKEPRQKTLTGPVLIERPIRSEENLLRQIFHFLPLMKSGA